MQGLTVYGPVFSIHCGQPPHKLLTPEEDQAKLTYSQRFCSQANLLPGLWPIRTLELSLPGVKWGRNGLGTFVPWNFVLKSIRSQERLLPRTFVPC